MVCLNVRFRETETCLNVRFREAEDMFKRAIEFNEH